MKIIKQNAIIMDAPTVDGVYKFIEKIGRICYKSEDNITDDSAEKFCVKMKINKHYAMLEHYMIQIGRASCRERV